MSARGTPLAIDIVINNHNYGGFVIEAVASACAQDHRDLKVVVVDDGSTDDSRERLAEYDGPFELVLKEQGGQASALNAGLERCHGDVVMFLDADDLLRPGAARRVAAAFALGERVVKTQFRMEVIGADGRRTGVTKPASHLLMPSGDLIRSELAFPFDIAWMPTSGNAFRRDALETILPIPERDYPLAGADWYLVHLMTLLGEVASLDEIGAAYRVHGANRYEPQTARLDLSHIRDTIRYADVTARSLARLADALSLPRPARLLSLSDLANRLLSLKLEREHHPIAGDRPWRLLVDAIRATGRRFDVAWPLRIAMVMWFAVTAAAPRPAVRLLGELFMFPERRTMLNRVLAPLHHGGP